jgi:hypothetical protein
MSRSTTKTTLETSQCVELSQSASEILGELALIVDADDPGTQLTRDAIKVADFLASVRQNRNLNAQHEMMRILQHGINIEDSLRKWPDGVPAHWNPTPRESSTWPSCFAYRGRIHTYHDIQIASIWNCYRRTRIALLEAIVELANSTLVHGDSDYGRIQSRSLESIQDLSDDVCSSVPFHIGTWTAGLSEKDVQFPPLENGEIELIHRQAALVCGWFLLLLPLSRLKRLQCLDLEQAQWVSMQYSRICAIAGHRYHITGAVAEELLAETFPAFAYAQAINIRTLM